MTTKNSSPLLRRLLHVGVAGSLLAGQAMPLLAARDTQTAVTILTQKAQALEARDRDDLASQIWQQVLVADPSNSTALVHLAQYASHTGHSDTAKAYLERLRKVAPEMTGAVGIDAMNASARSKTRLEEASRLANDHRPEEAMLIYREVFGDTPPAGRWAVPYYETLAGTTAGRDAALNGLRDLIGKYPSVPEYRASLGKLLTYTASTRQAGIDMLAQVSGSTSAVNAARLAWRQALVWEKLNAAYAPSVQLFLSRYPDPELVALTTTMRDAAAHPAMSATATAEDRKQQLGYAALKAGDLAGAEQNFQASSSSKGGDWRAEAGLGFVAMKKGDFETAAHHFEAAERLPGVTASVRAAHHEANFWIIMGRASKASQAEDWTSAVDLYESALKQKPDSMEAVTGLGGALLAADRPAKAIPYLKRVVHMQPSSRSAWSNLAKATLASGDGAATLHLIASVPEGVSTDLELQPDWRALEALAYQKSGNDARALSIYKSILATDTSALPANVQTQMASLALAFHEPAQAVAYARRAIEMSASNTGAWEILFSALVTSGQKSDAQRVFNEMPPKQRTTAEQHVGFEQTLASLDEANGDYQGALTILEPLSQNGRMPTAAAQLDLKLHLADLSAKLGHTKDVEQTLQELSLAHPEDISVWRTRFQILNQLKEYEQVVSLAAQMPRDVALKLGDDNEAVSLLATANASIGHRAEAVRLLETHLSRTSDKDSPSIQREELQLGWLLLDTPSASGQLYRLLEKLDASSELPADQKKQLTDLWTTWIVRTADNAQKSGDIRKAITLLDAGNQRFPKNPGLQKALAGVLLASGDTKRALNFYSNWGLADGDPDDYSGAIGAALAQHNNQFATAWLNTALATWPGNSKILTLAGELAQSQGDFKHARAYWQAALAQQQAQPQSGESGSARDSSLRSMLVGADVMPPVSATPAISTADPTWGNQAWGSQAAVPVHLSSYGGETRSGTASNSLVLANALGVSTFINPANSSPAESNSLEDKLASLDSRNTPYMNSQMSVWGRGGQAGFDRLLIEQADFEASTTLSNTLRASLILRPTYLSSGVASGSGDSLFGRQTATESFGPQSASGIAGEVQLSSDSVGLRIGSTPRGFLTSNWLGGFRLRPKHGHITFVLERENVKDTLLSYSGVRDPITQQISGGVMANSGSVQGQWGSSTSGVYVSGGYQALDGRNVERNTAVNGNLGTWWKVASVYGGSVTVGMNFSGMGYDRNLRYFTFGQGGYFSPQQYFLFNVPVRWAGHYERFEYSVAGSYGLQHFTEDTSPYYPNDQALQATSKQMYPALVVTGPNFNFDARLAYQMAPHWMLGGFVTASNARDYTAASAGVFAKYTFDERPRMFVETAPSIPDWRGQQPFTF